MQSTRNYAPAILWVLLSTFLWTVIFAAGKFADGGVGVFQLTFLRYLGALFVLLILVRARGGLKAHRSAQPLMHLARAVCGCSAAVAITWASANMPLVDATAIGMLYGVIAVLLGAVILKERISRQHWRAITVCALGVAIVMISKGAFRGGVAILPALAAFLSATLLAIEGLLISILGRAERALSVMLYITIFGCGLMLLPAIAEWRTLPTDAFILCLSLGPLGLLGQYCTIRGYCSAPLSVVAPVDYSWLFFSSVLGVLVFKETANLGTWIGCLVIVLGGVFLARLSSEKR